MCYGKINVHFFLGMKLGGDILKSLKIQTFQHHHNITFFVCG